METLDSASTDAGSLRRSTGPLDQIQHALHRFPVISPALVLLASCIVFTLFGDGRFQQPDAIGIILQQTAVLATLAIGQTLIILTAGVDLAVGTAMLLTHLVVAKVAVDQGVPAVRTLLIGAAVGIAIGAFEGGLVAKVGLPPFIVTLGTFYIFGSLGLVRSEAQTISKDALGGEGLAAARGRARASRSAIDADHHGRARFALGHVRVVRLRPAATPPGAARVRRRRRPGRRPAGRHRGQQGAAQRLRGGRRVRFAWAGCSSGG